LYYGDTIASFSSYTLNMLQRIFKIVATGGSPTALECTKFVFGPRCGSLRRAPQTLYLV